MAAPLVPTSTPGVYKRGSRYVFRFRDPQGKLRQRSARTIGEAKRLRAETGADVIRGEYRAQSRVTLGDYARTWGNTYTGRTGRGVRRETLADYRRDLDLYVIPFFGARTLLSSIEPRHVKDFARSLADRGLAPNTVRVVFAPLRALLATAVEEGLIRHNPAIGLRLAGGERRTAPKALAPEELIALIAQMPEGMPRLLVRFLAATGLRAGEVKALMWADLDVAERRIRIERRLYRGRTDAPKSRYGVRVIPVSRDMAHDLAAHRLATPFSNDGDPIFANTAGSPLDANNFSARVLKPAAERAGVPWASFHTFRHTCASNLMRAGVTPKQVQVWMGHHSAAFTMTTYAHLLPDDLPDGDVLDRFVSDPGVTRVSPQATETDRNGTVLNLPNDR
jgi:integrase